jgi:hypothetical protein
MNKKGELKMMKPKRNKKAKRLDLQCDKCGRRKIAMHFEYRSITSMPFTKTKSDVVTVPYWASRSTETVLPSDLPDELLREKPAISIDHIEFGLSDGMRCECQMCGYSWFHRLSEKLLMTDEEIDAEISNNIRLRQEHLERFKLWEQKCKKTKPGLLFGNFLLPSWRK